MRRIVPQAALVLFVVLLLASLAWLLSTPLAAGSDEDWRWGQPLEGSSLPPSPAAADLFHPFLLATSPPSFEASLPTGTYGYALAEVAPVQGGHLLIVNDSGGALAESEWTGSNALGYFASGLLQGFSGGVVNFSATGSGRALLLRLDVTIELADGSATASVQGRLASSIPLALTQAQHGHASRLHIRWSGATSFRVVVIDQDFHRIAEGSGNNGDLELRLGASDGAYYVLEGDGEVQLGVAPETPSTASPVLPGLLIVVSAAGISLAGRALRGPRSASTKGNRKASRTDSPKARGR